MKNMLYAIGIKINEPVESELIASWIYGVFAEINVIATIKMMYGMKIKETEKKYLGKFLKDLKREIKVDFFDESEFII